MVPKVAPSNSLSIPILRIVIFISGFDTVMAMAQRLPVALIPEENTITSVRDDVVNICCLGVLAFLQALYAEGMRFEVTLACLLPCSAVASCLCAAHLFRVERLVYLAVLCAAWHEGSTAWVSAGHVGTPWHYCSQGRLSFPK